MRILLAAAAGYLALALLLTHPVLPVLESHFLGNPGDSPDLANTVRFHWIYDHAFSRGEWPVHTDRMYFPFGFETLRAQGTDLWGYLAVPFRRAFGFPAYYNLMAILLTALNGFCGFLLVRRCTGSAAAGAVGGAVLAMNPYTALELRDGRQDTATLFLPCLCLLFLLKSRWEPGFRNPLLAALLFFLTTATYFYFGLFVGLAALVVLGAALRDGPGPARRVGAAVALLVLPALPVLAYYGWLSMAGRIPFGIVGRFPAEEVFLRSAAERSVPWMVIVSACGPEYPVRPSANGAYVSLAAMALLLAGFGWGGRRPGLWAPLFLLFYVLSLGPFLKLGRSPVALLPNPLYDLASLTIPFFSRLIHLNRLTCMVILATGVLLGLALLGLRDRLGAKGGAFAILCLGAVLLYGADLHLTGYYPPPVTEFRVPDFVRTLASEPDCGVIDLPYTNANLAGLLQPIHGKAALGGTSEAFPLLYSREYLEFVQKEPFVSFLLALNQPDGPQVSLTRRDVDAVQRLGYKYLIVHRQQFFLPPRPDAQRVHDQTILTLRRWFGTPAASDDMIEVFRLDGFR